MSAVHEEAADGRDSVETPEWTLPLPARPEDSGDIVPPTLRAMYINAMEMSQAKSPV